MSMFFLYTDDMTLIFKSSKYTHKNIQSFLGKKIYMILYTYRFFFVFPGKSRLVGDMLALGGAFLTGICHVGLEHSVQYYDMHEFLGLVGLFGTIITTVQM